jgi:hypothetical protein
MLGYEVGIHQSSALFVTHDFKLPPVVFAQNNELTHFFPGVQLLILLYRCNALEKNIYGVLFEGSPHYRTDWSIDDCMIPPFLIFLLGL